MEFSSDNVYYEPPNEDLRDFSIGKFMEDETLNTIDVEQLQDDGSFEDIDLDLYNENDQHWQTIVNYENEDEMLNSYRDVSDININRPNFTIHNEETCSLFLFLIILSLIKNSFWFF